MEDLKEIQFIKQVLIAQAEKLMDAKQFYPAIIWMTQAIEVMGAFLDEKPFKADAQSKIRFRKALYLFPERYQKINQKDLLYEQLRCNFSHLLLPGLNIKLIHKTLNPEANHLSLENDKLIIVAEDFLNDFKIAAYKLVQRIESGKVSPKKLNSNFFKHIDESNFLG